MFGCGRYGNKGGWNKKGRRVENGNGIITPSRTSFTSLRESNRVTSHTTESIQHDIAATPFCYLVRDSFGCDRVPSFFVKETSGVVKREIAMTLGIVFLG
jgi:hypothetical protein